MGAPFWYLRSVFRQQSYTGKEVDRADLAALFAFYGPVAENFNGNVKEIFSSRVAHYLK
jgi:hypothetical protein